MAGRASPATTAPGANPTVIIGGGLAGISAAMHLQRPYRLFERAGRLGGLARTEERDGYLFDRTGHWLHLRDDGMRQLAERLLGDELARVERRAQIYSNGVLTPYPFQANLHGLPAEVIHECLWGVVRAHLERGDRVPPRNFEEFILHHFGEGIARHFMIPYNTKLWGVPPREITSAWCRRFVPVPELEQVIAGAVGTGPPELGYNISFRYPRHGGIETFSRALIAQLDPERYETAAAVEAIDSAARTVTVGGETVAYHSLIATLPLSRLVALLRDPPAEVVDAASKLRATPVRYLNVALTTPTPADYHWVYVPEERLPFYRVGVFSNAMPSMAPPGCSSLYVELSDRGPLVGRGDQAITEAVRALVELSAIGSAAAVRFADLREIDPAYVIFDEHYEEALATIHPYLESQRIYAIGRYGAWIYNAMEDSLLAGKATAERVDGLGRGDAQEEGQ